MAEYLIDQVTVCDSDGSDQERHEHISLDVADITESFERLSPSPKKSRTEKLPSKKSASQSDSCKKLSFQDESEQLYKEDPQCPIFSNSAPFFSLSEACNIILNPGDKACTKMPRGCRRASTFILDTSCLDHPNDYKADDNGSFRHHGAKVECIELDDDGEVTCIADPKMLRPGQYKLSRTYWVHSSTKDYKKRSVILEDHSGEVYPVIILQYSNTGKEEDVKVEPHQNSKKSH
ncbi:hypothetical protein OS493_012866 [Desmophyllum pertusum]|uniref:Uncharacterized protein n=1 Tax=Desmophyllum pertusum TaxID=174260 RepID=A0A9W9Z181_9CNID|nr:hypothetical protein OS493_012866 [Desmophyllum pertusum]